MRPSPLPQVAVGLLRTDQLYERASSMNVGEGLSVGREIAYTHNTNESS